MAEQQKGTEKMRPDQAGNRSPLEPTNLDDVRDESRLERVELLAADAEDREDLEADGFGEQLAQVAVTTEEEVDALTINLLQEDEPAGTGNGTGRVFDDGAEERIARFTESDRAQADRGAVSVEPGRDNTSDVLRLDHPDSSLARTDALVEDNLDEPMDETVAERNVDEAASG